MQRPKALDTMQRQGTQRRWRWRIVRARGVRGTMRTSSTKNQLSRIHRGSQRLKGQTWNLFGSELGPLHVPYGCVAWCSYGNFNSGTEDCPWLFFLNLESFSSYRVTLSSFERRVCACSYCNLSSHVWLISLVGLLCFICLFVVLVLFCWKENRGVVDLGKRGGREGLGGVEGGETSLDIYIKSVCVYIYIY